VTDGWRFARLQDITLLQHMRKSDQKMSVYFVKTSAELQWSCSDTGICALPSSSQESRSSPTLLKQLVELEFFSDVGGIFTDGLASRPPSDLERTLGSTLVQAVSEQPSGSPDCGAEAESVVCTKRCNMPDVDPSFQPCRSSDGGDVGQQGNKTDGQFLGSGDEVSAEDADRSVYACGSPPTDGDVGDADRPTSTLSAALSVERSCSDIDSESYPLMTESELVDGLTDGFCSGLASFAGSVLQSRLLSTVALMNTVHRRCLETMISVAFDMAWDVICTPTRIKFARTKEVKTNCTWLSLQFVQFEI